MGNLDDLQRYHAEMLGGFEQRSRFLKRRTERNARQIQAELRRSERTHSQQNSQRQNSRTATPARTSAPPETPVKQDPPPVQELPEVGRRNIIRIKKKKK